MRSLKNGISAGRITIPVEVEDCCCGVVIRTVAETNPNLPMVIDITIGNTNTANPAIVYQLKVGKLTQVMATYGAGDYLPYTHADYRFGYNGMEVDPEQKGQGNSYTTEFRQYDPRLGRWLTYDPVFKPYESPYASNGNNPIWFVDPSGADSALAAGSTTWQWSVEEGDTYNSISQRTGVPVEDLRKFNQDLVKDDTKIPTFEQSGQLLHLSDPSASAPSSRRDIVLPDGTISIMEYTNYLLETQIYLTFNPGVGVNKSDYIWLQTFETNDPLDDDDNGADRTLSTSLVFQTDDVAGYNLYNRQVTTNNQRITSGGVMPTVKPKLLSLPFAAHIPIYPTNASVVGFADRPWRPIANNGQIQWNGTLMLCKKVDGNYIIYKTFSYSWTQVLEVKTQNPIIYQDTNPADGTDSSERVNSFLNK